MAHGRQGPDIVQNTRYASASQVRAVSEHEKNRSPDGSSAIDPARSHMNEVLVGPETQQDALDQFYKSGVKEPAAQAETPFVQMVLSASPGFFRTEGRDAGEWDPERLREWREATLEWLRSEFGPDLLHVSLHLDEDTPHMHVLIAPTYEKKPRKPGRRKKNETEEEFEARKIKVENAEPVRCVGRASNDYWSRKWCRRAARESYHASMEPLGLGYGRDFVGAGEPSPERKETGAWVREQAAKLKEDRAQLDVERQQLREDQQHLDQNWNKLEIKRDKIIEELKQQKKELSQIRASISELLEVVRKSMRLPTGSRSGIVANLKEMLDILKPAPKLKTEKTSSPERLNDPFDNSGPGF